MKKILMLSVAALFLALVASQLAAHCEIPCGIYDDPMRIRMINEHIDTIARSIHEIEHLKAAKNPDLHRLTRWTVNKENHATELQHIVAQYFMTQRVVPAEPGSKGYDRYVAQLTLLHKIQVEAMKSKQSLDPGTVDRLRQFTAVFEKLYFSKPE